MKNLTSWIGGLSLVVLLLIIAGLFLLGKRTFYPENEYYTNVAVTESKDINYDDYCTREKVDMLIAENDTLRAKLDLLLLKQYDLDEQRAIFSNELAKTNMFYTLFVTIFGVVLTVFITWYIGWKMPKSLNNKITSIKDKSNDLEKMFTKIKLNKLHYNAEIFSHLSTFWMMNHYYVYSLLAEVESICLKIERCELNLNLFTCYDFKLDLRNVISLLNEIKKSENKEFEMSPMIDDGDEIIMLKKIEDIKELKIIKQFSTSMESLCAKNFDRDIILLMTEIEDKINNL